MIIAPFKNYNYYGVRVEGYTNKDYAFNDQYFDQLISEQQYSDAADYLSNFKFNDIERQTKLNDDIAYYRQQAKKQEYLNKHLLNDDERDKVTFANAIFDPDKLNSLVVRPNYVLPNGQPDKAKMSSWHSNKYAEEFMEFKKQLGSSDDVEATALQIEFAPEKRTFLGIDFLARDNDNTIDEFYKRTGLDAKTLEAYGVRTSRDKDGYTTITFDKTNPLSNKILYNIKNPGYKRNDDVFMDSTTKITGVDKNGNTIAQTRQWKEGEHRAALDVVGQIFGPVNIYRYLLSPNAKRNRDSFTLRPGVSNEALEFQSRIEEAMQAKDNVEKLAGTNKIQVSSTVFDFENDKTEIIRQRRRRGEITTDEQMNKELERAKEDQLQLILAGGVSTQKFYSNLNNENPLDRTQRELGPEDRALILRNIGNVYAKNKNLVTVENQIVDGQVGILITAYGPYNDKFTEKDDFKNSSSGRDIQLFIPGLDTYRGLQQRINSDTKFKAMQEANDIKEWDYTYNTVAGLPIKYDGKNGYTINGKSVTEQDVQREINKDYIKRYLKDQLIYDNLSASNNIISRDDFTRQAKERSVEAFFDLYPNVDLTKTDGSRYKLEDLFTDRVRLDLLNDIDNNETARTTKYQLYNQLKDLYDIYGYILSGLDYYDRINLNDYNH